METGKDFRSLFKFRAIDQYLYQIFIDSEIYFSGRFQLNDPNESIIRFTKQELDAQVENGPFEVSPLVEPLYLPFNNTYYFCMTRDPQSLPLWSYYGDSHHGICLEFDFSCAIKNYLDDPTKPWKIEANDGATFIDDVHYHKDLDEYTLAADNSPKLSLDESFSLGFRKLICWEHEREVRMQTYETPTTPDQQPSKGKFWKIEKSWLKAVYFGLRTTKKNKDTVVSLARSTGFSCGFHEAYKIAIHAGAPKVQYRDYA